MAASFVGRTCKYTALQTLLSSVFNLDIKLSRRREAGIEFEEVLYFIGSHHHHHHIHHHLFIIHAFTQKSECTHHKQRQILWKPNSKINLRNYMLTSVQFMILTVMSKVHFTISVEKKFNYKLFIHLSGENNCIQIMRPLQKALLVLILNVSFG